MKLMPCPLNGLRNISEFVCAGEVHERPEAGAPVKVWADYVFKHDNRAGVVFEWWMHIPSSYWFIAERDTSSNTIIKTYTVKEFRARPKEARLDDSNSDTGKQGSGHNL